MVDLSKGGEPWASSLPTGFNYGDGAPDRARWEADARQPFRLECAFFLPLTASSPDWASSLPTVQQRASSRAQCSSASLG